MTLLAPLSATGEDIVGKVRIAFDQAVAGMTRLSPEVLAMPGMSGRKYRSFVNSLVSLIVEPRYLEVGSWAGSTLCSAILGNSAEAVAVDNWSQFGGPAGSFFQNLAHCKGTARVSFLEQDFRRLDFEALRSIYGPYNIYLFDGPHAFEDQYDGIIRAQPALQSRYVQIVDDWNWQAVRDGTMKAIADLGLHVELMIEIRTTLDESHAAGE